jgi:hypothetical protein
MHAILAARTIGRIYCREVSPWALGKRSRYFIFYFDAKRYLTRADEGLAVWMYLETPS